MDLGGFRDNVFRLMSSLPNQIFALSLLVHGPLGAELPRKSPVELSLIGRFAHADHCERTFWNGQLRAADCAKGENCFRHTVRFQLLRQWSRTSRRGHGSI